MKKQFTIAVIVLCSAIQLYSQNLLKEPFDYAAKDSLDGIGGWFSSNVKSKIKIVSPGLSYSGYAGSGIGNAVKFSNADNGDVCTKNLVKIDTGTVFLSYLINVDSLTSTATSGYNITMDQYGGATNVNLHSNIQRITDSTFWMGITKLQGTVYSKKVFKTKQTYLVVLKYQFVPGTANDTAKIFVYSNGVPVAEPVQADTFMVAGSDAADIGEIWLSNSFAQSGLKNSPVTIDEIRVGTSWGNTVLDPIAASFTEDFYYAPGDSVRGKNGWDVLYGGTPLFVDSTGLSYSGYPGSGLGKALKIVGGGASQNLFRNFSTAGDSTLYMSAMVNLSGTNSTQGFFLILGNSGSGNFRAIVYAKIETSKVYFGLRPTLNGTLVFDPTKYSAGQTYLIVVKYRTIAGLNNDEISMFVFSSGVPYKEPVTAAVGPLVMPNDNIPPSSVVLSSGAFAAGSTLNGAIIRADGIRITNNWKIGLTPVQNTKNFHQIETFALSQNYPNPFNPSTVISYQLPVNGHVSLKVYDAIGREVATLVNEVKEAGTYSMQFDGRGLSSGMYFARLQSGGNVQIKKMVMLK